MKRFVAFLDILGFKHMVEDREHIELIEIMKMFKTTIDISNSLPIPITQKRISLVHYITFSDSIVLYTDGTESHDFFRIVHVVKLLIGCSLGNKTPLRGSIAHGDFYADRQNNIFFGNALVAAYENEDKQQWAGAYICDHTVDFVLSTYPEVVDSLKKYAYLIEYLIPFKSSVEAESRSRLAVNWANTPIDYPLSLEKCVNTGYAFLSAQFDSVYQIVNQDESLKPEDKLKLLFHVDTKLLPKDIWEKWKNTCDFYNIAKENGKCPMVYGHR